MTRTIQARRTVLLAALLASAASPIAAQTASKAPVAATGSTALDGDIIVTAQRRAERIQDVPIAVSVVTAADILARSSQNIADLLTTAPNVTRTGGGSGKGDANFFVRGIGQVDNSVAVDPGVGIYVDEVYLGRLQGASFDLFDIERVEVLRGPQGTLWGKNTIGGAISVITRDPKLGTTSASVRGVAGSRNHFDAFGNVNLPIGDKWAVTAAGIFKRQDGYARNVYTGTRFSGSKVEGGRIKLLGEINDQLSVRLSADYVHDHGTPSNIILLAYNPNLVGMTPFGPMAGLSPTGIPLLPDQGADRGDQKTSYNGVPALDTTNSGGVQGTVTWAGDNVEIKSITAYRKLHRSVWNDFDGTGYRFYDSFNEIRQHQFSEELHLTGQAIDNRLHYVLGAYYFHENAFNQVNLCTGNAPPRLTGPCLNSENPIRLIVDSYAGFANVNFAVTDRLSVTGGIRYTYEKKKQSFASYLVNQGVTGPGFPVIFIPPGSTFTALPPSSVHDSFSSWTPKVTIDFKPSSDILLYGSYAQGFKSGGFSGRPSNSTIVSYRPEVVNTFEIGAKTTLLPRKLFFNVAAFTSNYKDIQLLITIPPGLFDTANAGTARIKGVEAELFGQPVKNLGLTLTAGYLDAKYTKLAPNIVGLALSNRLPLVSKWTLSAGAQYRIPITNTSDFTVRADYSYRSTFSFQLENDPFEIEKGYGLVNLRGQYNFGDGKYSIAVYGLNVAGKKYFLNRTDGLNSLGIAVGIPGRPAEWAAEFSARF